MDKQHIRILITRFFEDNYPKEFVLKFQQWFTCKENGVLKDEVLNELWEQETAEADERTLQGLKEMNRRIGKAKNPVRISLPQRLLRIASIFLLPIVSALLTYWIMQDEDKRTTPEAGMVEYMVPDGEMKQIILPDGSEVCLNAGSMLLYSGNLSGPDRCLYLSGEATFRVEKDPERPFIVKTQYMQVEALGTTFNVKSYRDSGITEITLEEGLVRVNVDGKVRASELIRPDEQFVYDHRQGEISKHPIDAELVAKWKEGYLVFKDASFEEIIRTVERRFNVTVHYDIRKYGGGRFSVKYTPYEDVQQVLMILETLNPGLKWNMEGSSIYIK